jgi:hypothetical protein
MSTSGAGGSIGHAGQANGVSGSAGTVGTSGSANGGAGATTSGGGAAGSNAGGSSAGGGVSGSAGANGGASGSGSTAVQMLTPIINAFCAAARSCCAKQGVSATLDDCEAMFPMREPTVASVASGAITLDPTALAACRAAYTQAATSCTENPVVSACQNVFVGTRAENEACSNGQECKRDQGPVTCLITTQNGTSGVCKKIPHGKAGDACSFDCEKGEDCSSTTYGVADSNITLCFEEDGLYCDTSSDAAKCAPILALNAPCTGFDACGSANFCETTCQKLSTLGEPCGEECLEVLECIDNQCQSPPFASDSICMGYSYGP